MQHSIVPPSSAAQWVYCAAAIQAQAAIPEIETDDNKVGLALHEVASGYFLHGLVAQVGDCILGVTLDQEMLDRVQKYIDIVSKIYFESQLSGIEQRVNIATIHPECFGTPDAWVFDGHTCTLTVPDYKDGFIKVDAIENWQVICYIAGIVEVHLPHVDKQKLKIKVIIVQPQDYQGSKTKEWNITYLEIEHLITRLRIAAHAALEPNPIATAGKHCTYCRAKLNCTSFSLTCHSFAVAALQNPEAPENDISIELRFLQDAYKMIGLRLTVLEAEALQKIKSGEIVQYYKAGFGQGKLIWTDTSNLDNLAKMLGITVRKPEAPLLTATQVKAELKKKKLPEDTLSSITEYRQGKIKLLPAESKYAEEIFKEK